MDTILLSTQSIFLQAYGSSFDTYVWITVCILVFGIALRQYSKIIQVRHNSNWSLLVDGFKISPQEFYKQLGEEIGSRGLPGLKPDLVKLSTAGVFSADRLYARINWKDHVYDISCFPVGTGMYFSWWMYPQTSMRQKIVYSIPWIGPSISKLLTPMTYYRSDSNNAYMTYVHQCMLAVIEDITTEVGYRIPENKRTPDVSDILKR